MKQGYLLREITCSTCKMAVAVNPHIFETLDQLKVEASKLHAGFDSGAICPKPMLVEIYWPCLVSNEVFKPAPQIIIPNGNGRH